MYYDMTVLSLFYSRAALLCTLFWNVCIRTVGQGRLHCMQKILSIIYVYIYIYIYIYTLYALHFIVDASFIYKCMYTRVQSQKKNNQRTSSPRSSCCSLALVTFAL